MIKWVELHDDLLERAVDELLAVGRPTGESGRVLDFSNIFLVFPSQRISFFLKARINARVGHNYLPPHMMTIDRFFENIFDRHFPAFEHIGELEAALVLYEGVRKVFGDSLYYGGRVSDNFPGFFPWALNLWHAVEEALVEGAELDKLDIDIFKDFVKYGDYHQDYKDFIAAFPDLVHTFALMLEERKKATRGLVYRKVAELSLEEGRVLTVMEDSRFIFLGFFALNNSEETVLSSLFNNAEATMLLRADSEALSDPSSPFYLQRNISRILGGSKPPPEEDDDKGHATSWKALAKKVHLYADSNSETMMARVYKALKEIVDSKNSPDELLKVGVVLPDSSSLIPFVQGVVSRFDMEKETIPFNITLGYPFERTPLYRLLDLMLRVGTRDRKGRIYAMDYLDLVRHPYVKLSAQPDHDPMNLRRGIHVVEEILGDENLLYFKPHQLETLLAKRLQEESDEEGAMPDEIVAAVQHIHKVFIIPASTDFQQLCAFLKEALELLDQQRAGYLFLREYIATAQSVIDQMMEFAASYGDEVFGGADYEAGSSFLKYYISKSAIHFQGSPLRGVQVMGMLEFRGLTFDDVLVVDAVEGVLPESRKYDALLPFDIRKALNIRVYTDWEQLFAYNFFSLVGGARQSHIFWPERTGTDRAQRSRFIERVIYEIEKATGSCDNFVENRVHFSLKAPVLKAVEKDEKIRQRLKELALAPSTLETYIKCPLKFYFERVLRIRERQEITADPDAGEFGNIVHETLQRLYQVHLANDPRMDLERAFSLLEAELLSQFTSRGLGELSGAARIRFWVLNEKLKKFLAYDLDRIRQHSIAVIGFEEDLSVRFPVKEAGLEAVIGGRIDRVEQEGQIRRIADYKTGNDFPVKIKSPHKEFDIQNLWDMPPQDYIANLNAMAGLYTNFQILLYIYMYNRQKVRDIIRMDAAYMFLRSEKSFFKEVFVTGNKNEPLDGEGKRDVMNRFEANLEELIMDIHKRDLFVANPSDAKYCSYCPFKVPCGNL
jgi:hypothetical protein